MKLNAEQLDLVWTALRHYVRDMNARGDKEEAQKAHELSRVILATKREKEAR